jgi:hypothetical protein
MPKTVQAEIEITVSIQFTIEDDENPDDMLGDIVDHTTVNLPSNCTGVDINFDPIITSIEED